MLGAISTLLLLASLLVFFEVGVTYLWQDPFSALYSRLEQGRLDHDLRRLERQSLAPDVQFGLAPLSSDRARINYLAQTLKRTAPRGAAVGRIFIPSIGAHFVLVNGTDTSALEKGPGIYPQTPFPGAAGTSAIAGHRTTYLAPFRAIDRLRPRQAIVIRMPYAQLTYSVEKTRVVEPTDFSVIRRVGYDRLVLTACDPPFSAAKRIVVFARLVQRGAGGPAVGRALPCAPTAPGGPSLPVLVLVICAIVTAPPGLYVGWSRLRRSAPAQ
ncbi:MAG: sortase [Solirubrobacteraceae bacterium]